MKKIVTTVVLALGLVLASTACTPEIEAKEAIRQAFPASQYDKAVAVATCESKLDPMAVSRGGGNWGLFQINKIHKSALRDMGYEWADITDPVVNAKFARVLFDESGWRPWSCA